MDTGANDTAPEAQKRMTEIYRRMTPTERLQRVRDLTLTAHALALAGLRQRHPEESEHELHLRLARQRLGPELFDKIHSESTADVDG